MSLDQLYPYGFRSTLFDRLLPENDVLKGLSLQELDNLSRMILKIYSIVAWRNWII